MEKDLTTTAAVAFYCTRCRKLLRFSASSRGTLVFCPHCQQKIIVPDLETQRERGDVKSNVVNDLKSVANELAKTPKIVAARTEAAGQSALEGVPVASHLTPGPNRRKKTRRVLLGSTAEISTCSERTEPVAAPLSDADFARLTSAEPRRVVAENCVAPPIADVDAYRRDALRFIEEEREALRNKKLRVIVAAVGVLVVGVGAFLFLQTSFFGNRSDKTTSNATVAAEPLPVDGRLTYRTASGRTEGDEGAFVFVFPVDGEFGESLTLGNASPERGTPPDFDEFVAKLEARGGRFAVADFDGRFTISAPGPGEYDVLLVSRGVADAPNDADKAALEEISRYLFLPEQKLLAKRRFIWKRVRFARDAAVVEEDFGKSRY